MQGFANINDFAILAVKNVPYMIKNHNLIHDQSVILGAVRQRRIQALIYWERDQKHRGIIIAEANWKPVTMAEATEHVNSDTPHK